MKEKESKHREISVAEFFEKNKHILGYSNPSKALITVVKEAVDNALDACEEAGILPDIYVRISRSNGHFRIVVEDNGPGIPKEQIPRVFGKLLYGSRFHEIRQSRGQQGIGISAAVLYAQLTTGKPAKIVSKTADGDAYRVVLYINTKKNEPEIVEEGEEDWYMPHGTRIELEIAGSYVRERKQSVLEYLKETSVVNPHAKITFVDPDGNIFEFERVSDEVPKTPKAIKPHPHGIELGTLMSMLKSTKASTLKKFLKDEFVRVGDKIAEDVLRKAGFTGSESPRNLTRDDAAKLLDAFKSTDFLPPPTNCLSPIGESMITKSLIAEYSPEFVYAVTRKPKVYSGHPFLVEVGIAYGGEIRSEDKVILLRYANKIPLLYQQSGCALTKAVESVNWKNYGLNQNKSELPSAPAVILIHLASTNIPYTSESKEAVATIPEIIDEVRLALQEVGRKLKEYLERRSRHQKRKKKEEVISKILPLIAQKVCEVLEREPVSVDRVVARIMGYVHVERDVSEANGVKDVVLRISNYSRSKREFRVFEMCSGEVFAEGAKVTSSAYTTVSWNVALKPDEELVLRYKVKGRILNRKPLIDGIDADSLSGAEVLNH